MGGLGIYYYTETGNYTATFRVTTTDESTYTDTCEVTVVVIDSITVDSGATQTNVTGTKNWAAVKDADGKVIVEATLDPDIPESLVPAGLVTWTGGNAVEDHPLQREVSKATSSTTRVTATCSGSSDYVDIWILWGSVTIKMTGTTPPNAVQFGGQYDGTEILGARSYANGYIAVGKVVPIAQLTPAGVHEVVEEG